ncbi:MAG: hypothetical protein LBK74_04845 [Treponema sp.]|nr:hypothetical protein [Treponema sp.]
MPFTGRMAALALLALAALPAAARDPGGGIAGADGGEFFTGAGLFALNGDFTVPAETGRFSVGLAAGWRFLLGERWYVEPFLRAGYPYIAGGGVSAGFRL